MNKSQRIGVFGGTFDPIHLGHLAIARAARDQARLDKVLFVLAGCPPHKSSEAITPAPLRAAMVKEALRDESQFELSLVELERPGPSFTADTLRLLQKQLPEATLFLIVGYDSAIDIPKWRSPEEILKYARLLIAPRPDHHEPLPPLLQGRSELLTIPECPLSSSEIRTQLQSGENLESALPKPVLQFIQKHRLYQPCQ